MARADQSYISPPYIENILTSHLEVRDVEIGLRYQISKFKKNTLGL